MLISRASLEVELETSELNFNEFLRTYAWL